MNRFKHRFAWTLPAAFLVIAALLTACASPKEAPKNTAKKSEAAAETTAEAAGVEESHYICIEVENFGKIYAELYPDTAPLTVANFRKLVKEKFYDGLIFHRIIKGFMIQGGDPQGDGMGGPGYTIKGEFSANGVENKLKHEEGVLSMARSGHPDSAGSQFFIMDAAAPHLDGQYAAFGKVIKGLEIVHKIAGQKKDAADAPLEKIKIKSITFVTAKEAGAK